MKKITTPEDYAKLHSAYIEAVNNGYAIKKAMDKPKIICGILIIVCWSQSVALFIAAFIA